MLQLRSFYGPSVQKIRLFTNINEYEGYGVYVQSLSESLPGLARDSGVHGHIRTPKFIIQPDTRDSDCIMNVYSLNLGLFRVMFYFGLFFIFIGAQSPIINAPMYLI